MANLTVSGHFHYFKGDYTLKYDVSDILGGTSFFQIGDNTILLKGKIESREIMLLKNWVMSVKLDRISNPVLIIDSEGGMTDLNLISDMLSVPIHTHIVGEALSFAGVLALAGSKRTAVPGSFLMLHKSRWRDLKEAESIARDSEVLATYKYREISLLTSMVPAGIKEEVMLACVEDADVYFSANVLYNQGALDLIGHYSGEKLGVDADNGLWFDCKYAKGKLNDL